jgi:L-gulonate 3-dehydrogenase
VIQPYKKSLKAEVGVNKVAVVGAGLVGGSWALVFARAGISVKMYDISLDSLNAAVVSIRSSAELLESQGLLNSRSTAQIMAAIGTTDNLDEVLDGAEYIQECAPERLEIKRALYQQLGRLASPQAILASSTSGLPASSFSSDIQGRDRCVIVHPINPPHLIPLVEIVPAPWTSKDVVRRAAGFMVAVGQVPVRLEREIDGFIVNRLQSAILGEAFRLVEDGICSVQAIDTAMSDGLGLRWCFLGPFATIDLNAKGGVADYCKKLGPMYYELAKSQADPRPWSEALVHEVESQCREMVTSENLDSRKNWRDYCLAALLKCKRAFPQ